MKPVGPYTLDDFGTPMFRHSWRMTTGGKTYTWDEYERRVGTPAQIRMAQAMAHASIAMADEIVTSAARERKP